MEWFFNQNMKEKLIKISRIFYAVALLVYGIQQFIYADFRNVFFPAWQSKLILLPFWAIIFGILLIIAGAAIIFEKRAREALLILGGIFLALFCFIHIPYELIADPYVWHLGVWGNALKELALAGGAFIVSRTFADDVNLAQKKSIAAKVLEKITYSGEIFFSITMVSFGICHFLYIEQISKIVPDWIPDHLSWTYFAGVALIGSGTAIILSIRKRTIASLLGLMILLWFVLIHVPGALADPYVERGNLVSSAFDALAFSGTAFLIALTRESTGNTDQLN